MSGRKIANKLTPGAARACLKMSDEWQFCGKQTFDANGAHALHWTKGCGGRGALAEAELQRDGKYCRTAYRLTPLGLAVRAVLQEQSK